MNVSAEQLEDLPVTDEENYVNEIAEYIPKELKGHIIISAEGDAPLQSLALLLRNLWHKEYRKALRLKRREKVIIIHSNINDEVKKKFERFDGKSFFLLRALLHQTVHGEKQGCPLLMLSQQWLIFHNR